MSWLINLKSILNSTDHKNKGGADLMWRTVPFWGAWSDSPGHLYCHWRFASEQLRQAPHVLIMSSIPPQKITELGLKNLNFFTFWLNHTYADFVVAVFLSLGVSPYQLCTGVEERFSSLLVATEWLFTLLLICYLFVIS